MLDDKKKSKLNKVELTEEDLKRSIYWTVNKFNKDKFHKQHNSSRNDLIGGFLDRWVNRIPEFLIFDKLLEDKPYSPVTDNFIYDNDTAKNAPDIIGIKGNSGEYYPFTKFKNNRWDTPDDMPFVEMKVFKENHKLVTIPKRQFHSDHYYAIVESHIRDDYLTSIFEDSFFSKKYFDEIKKIDDFIELDEGKDQLLDPEVLKKNPLGTYELLGIYKGFILQKFCSLIGLDDNNKPESPFYFKQAEEYVPNDAIVLKSQNYTHYNKVKAIPLCIEINESISYMNIVNIRDLCISIEIEGNVKINHVEYSTGYYELKFRNEYHNDIKFYILDSIENVENPIIETYCSLYSGLFFHEGDNQLMISCKQILDKDIDIVDILDKKIDLKFNEEIRINNEIFNKGVYRFEFKADKKNKKIENLVYRVPKNHIKLDNKNYNYVFNLNRCQFTFCIESETSKYVPFMINIEHSSTILYRLFSRNFNKKDHVIFAVNGSVEINGYKMSDGFYKINFYEINSDGVAIFEFKNFIKIDNPLFSDKKEFVLEDSFYYHKVNNKKVIPAHVLLGEDSNIIVLKKTNEEVIIKVKGNAMIDNQDLSETKDKILYPNVWRLIFKPFERNATFEEYILSKGVLASVLESSEEELISEFDNVYNNFNNKNSY